MVTEAAKGTSSGAGDLAEAADFVEEGLSAEGRKRSGELHSLLLLCVVVEAAEEENGGPPGKKAMGESLASASGSGRHSCCHLLGRSEHGHGIHEWLIIIDALVNTQTL